MATFPIDTTVGAIVRDYPDLSRLFEQVQGRLLLWRQQDLDRSLPAKRP
ncbi:hypothetical protein [Nodosilinea sp. LEGE 07298]|nr:hypothetical protein [Nodosilinea sp. LEGE 07298]